MTEDEYDRLRDASAEQGARSVSEFARQALLGASHSNTPVHTSSEALTALDERIAKVEKDVALVLDELLAHSNDAL